MAFNKYLVNLITTVANLPERPTWNEESFFKRFAKTADAGAPVSGR